MLSVYFYFRHQSMRVPSHSQVIWHFKCALAEFPLHSLKHIWSLPMYSVSTSSLEEYIKLTDWGPLGNRIIRHNIFKSQVFHVTLSWPKHGCNIKGQPFMKRPFGMILMALLPSIKALVCIQSWIWVKTSSRWERMVLPSFACLETSNRLLLPLDKI